MKQNFMHLIGFHLKINKNKIIGWCVAIFCITFLYMILFPSVEGMAQIKMDAMPEELMQFVGMDEFTDMANFISYFGMIYNLLLIAISIFAVTFGASLIDKEEKDKTIEYLYSLPVSRLEIFLSKFFTGYIAVMAVICSVFVSSCICGLINGGETFILIDLISIIKLSSLTPFIFLALGSMIAGISSTISAGTIGSMVVILSYMLGFLSALVKESLSWLAYLSPFQLFHPDHALDLENKTFLMMAVYLLVLIIFVAIGGFVYKQRDLKV